MHEPRREPSPPPQSDPFDCAGPPPGPRYRRHLAEQPRPEPAADPFSTAGVQPYGNGWGPEFTAGYDSECSAAVCLGDGTIWEGEVARADGDGGFAHSECLEAED